MTNKIRISDFLDMNWKFSIVYKGIQWILITNIVEKYLYNIYYII